MARSKNKGDHPLKLKGRDGKIVMIIDDVEKVIIRRDVDSPEPTWLINADDLNNEEMVRNLLEPSAPRPATGRK